MTLARNPSRLMNRNVPSAMAALRMYGAGSPSAWAIAPPSKGPTITPEAHMEFMTPKASPWGTWLRSARSEISAVLGV